MLIDVGYENKGLVPLVAKNQKNVSVCPSHSSVRSTQSSAVLRVFKLQYVVLIHPSFSTLCHSFNLNILAIGPSIITIIES